MKLSIIIPVFNEYKTIASVVEQLKSLPLPQVTKEIIIVDDGSSDTSADIIKKITDKSIKKIFHEKNEGKGAAVRSGIKVASGDYILIQDADLEYNPNDIQKLIDPILERKAVVVYGTRLKRLPNFSRDERTVRFLIQYLGNKFLSLTTSIFYGQWITDMETGYKLFPKNAVVTMPLHARSFEFEPEITAKLMKSGYKIVEIPISTNPRGKDEGKKLSAFKDGPQAFWTLVKYRINNN